MTDPASLKRAAAAEAAGLVEDGMVLGLGSGSTAEAFVRALGERVRDGLRVTGVPSSERTAALARAEGIPLAAFDDHPALDLDVDGADELDRSLRLLKGGGGALLREKIVAAASARFVVVADGSKLVDHLGAFPLPIEVVPFGLEATRRAVGRIAASLGLDGSLTLRQRGGETFLTDGGHWILDASFGLIRDPEALAAALDAVPGIVEHGLFIGLATAAIIARPDGIERIQA